MSQSQIQRSFPRPSGATGTLGDASSFQELNKKAQAAWRDWFRKATSRDGELWNSERGCVDLRMSLLDGVDLSGLELAGALFDDSSLVSSQLDDSILPRASFRRCDLRNCTLRGAELTGGDFRWSVLDDTDFSGAVFGTSASFFRTRGERTNFSNAELAGAYFVDAQFNDANFRGALMRDSHLDGISVICGHFTGSDLSNAQLRHGTLRRCIFQNSSLASCDASNVDFSDSEFESADLSGCELAGARLASCRITRCRLKDASMIGASFEAARLTDLDLSEIDLSSVTLLHAVTENCFWPSMGVGITLTGKLRLPPALPRQPIDDVFGVPSHIRRFARMGQHLRDLEVSSRPSRITHFGFRLWGITSGYGLSITRWFSCCVAIVVLFGIGFYLESFLREHGIECSSSATSTPAPVKDVSPRQVDQGGTSESSPLKLRDAVMVSASVFLSIEANDAHMNALAVRVLVVLEVLSSYIMLGGLVTIFTARMVGL